jgi:hypothetical protein
MPSVENFDLIKISTFPYTYVGILFELHTEDTRTSSGICFPRHLKIWGEFFMLFTQKNEQVQTYNREALSWNFC